LVGSILIAWIGRSAYPVSLLVLERFLAVGFLGKFDNLDLLIDIDRNSQSITINNKHDEITLQYAFASVSVSASHIACGPVAYCAFCTFEFAIIIVILSPASIISCDIISCQVGCEPTHRGTRADAGLLVSFGFLVVFVVRTTSAGCGSRSVISSGFGSPGRIECCPPVVAF
jgi:hypothetical protein